MAVAVKVGPWGANRESKPAPIPGEQPLDIERASQPQSLVSIGISSSESQSGDGRIFAVSFVYKDQNKLPIKVGPWGKIDPQHPVQTITMAADEHLVKVKGTSSDGAGITSLKLVTNKRPYGPYGYPGGDSPFVVTLERDAAEVVAFFGCSSISGDTLTALGVYVLGKKDLPFKIGPWGGPAGEPVDVPSTPVKLQRATLYTTQNSDERIEVFSFVYIDQNVNPTHVGPWGWTKEEQIPVNPDDYVQIISGTSDSCGVTSLKFTTHNQIVHGPYGTPKGTAFSVPLPDDRDRNGAVVAFFGRTAGADSLVALGVYVGLAP